MVTVREILGEEQSAIRVAAAAVSVAAAIRDGTATAARINAFLQEDIPALDGVGPLPDVSEIGPDEGLTDMLKAGSVLALSKTIGALMEDDIEVAAKGADEYVALRRRAEKAGLSSAIISPPREWITIDEELQITSLELSRMIFLHATEDSYERWKALIRFTRKDWLMGLILDDG